MSDTKEKTDTEAKRGNPSDCEQQSCSKNQIFQAIRNLESEEKDYRQFAGESAVRFVRSLGVNDGPCECSRREALERQGKADGLKYAADLLKRIVS